MCLSKRPGRSSAGSSTSGLLVPASTTILVEVLNPGNTVDHTLPTDTLYGYMNSMSYFTLSIPHTLSYH